MKYRTRPDITIDAIKWDGENFFEVNMFMDRPGIEVLRMEQVAYGEPTLFIATPEGVLKAKVGSFIIKGTQGEFYPCMPEVFHAKYEEVR